MILKFNSLQKVGIFNNFLWEDCLKNQNGITMLFDKLNIIYGQNYAGKTTLSRIMRSLETGKFSKKYVDAKFSVICENEKEFTNFNLGENDYNIRVFNEDFIRDNIKFISDPEEAITPFAILGEINKDIEEEINRLEKILGSKKEKTGLYSLGENYQTKYSIHKENLDKIETVLQKNLSEKATGKVIGIKYKQKYDKINYDIKALRSDIEKVSNNKFKPLNREQILSHELLLNETIKKEIKDIPKPKLSFSSIQEKVSEVVTKVIGKSDKIDSLVKNAVLNRWVKEGRNLHTTESKCGFCNGVITAERWEELDRHFDEESEILDRDIATILRQIDHEERSIKDFQFYREEQFYNKFREELKVINDSIKIGIKQYLNDLQLLKNILIQRQNAILEAVDFHYISDKSLFLHDDFKKLETLRFQSNRYSQNLISDKESARNVLRLQDVYEYLEEISYTDTTARVKFLKETLDEIEHDISSVNLEIDRTILQISDNIKLITDESKGAEKINEYLEHHFGHKNLRLEPINVIDLYFGDKVGFEVQRDGKKAYHLSEGEKSLIAFCYFVAKLEDIETKGLKPVIWIDDPISSLDGNHIFFIYSLIKSQIYDKKDFLQLFVSTHNLNFLKYLKRLPTKKDRDGNAVKYFLVERIDKNSSLREMPKYLKEHATEFNYLFKSIYDCANIQSVNDSNYTLFYNFGNNARKFLEIYLFYKYPNFESDDIKYKKFFGPDPIPSILTNRLLNEYSHLCGVMERGEVPVEVPEMRKTAEIICRKIKDRDPDQFDALVKSLN